MKKTILTSLLLTLLMVGTLVVSQPSAQAQRKQDKAASASTEKSASEFGNVEGITAAQLKDYLYFVASDEMAGRNTPSKELDLTAKFIALNLSRWGFKPAGTDGTFLQKFPLKSRQVVTDGSSATINGQSFKMGDDFFGSPVPGTASGQLVYVGHGIVLKSKSINSYQGVDVKDKIMVVVEGLPKGLTFRDFNGKLGEDFDTPDTYARSHGAKGLIRIPSQSTLSFWEQRYKSTLTASRPTMDNPQMNGALPAITISEKAINALLQGESWISKPSKNSWVTGRSEARLISARANKPASPSTPKLTPSGRRTLLAFGKAAIRR